MTGLLPGIGGDVVLGVMTFDSGRKMGAGLIAVRGGGLCALFMGGGPEGAGAGAGTGEDIREIGAGGAGGARGAVGCEE